MLLRNGRSIRNRVCISNWMHFSTKPSPPFIDTSQQTFVPVIKSLSRFIWPENSSYRYRVVGAGSSLILAKVATVQVPILLGNLVDVLSVCSTGGIAATPLYMVLAYGGVKIASSGFNELRTILFSRVSQHACREVARSTFAHLHTLDLATISAQRGGEIQTIISRAVKSVTSILNMMLFNVVPTVVEFGCVLFVLWGIPVVGHEIAFITAATVGTYSVFTTKVTQIRTQYRRDMNLAEQRSAAQLIDSITNAESVRAFANEDFETKKYDKYLAEFEQQNVRVMTSLGVLNFGQQFIFTTGLIAAMAVAANAIVAGTLPVGHLVTISGLLFQLSVPLNFLGGVYRETKLNLVDYGKLLELTSIVPSIKTTNEKALEVVSGKVRLDNVSVELGGRKLLDSISIEIPEKTTLGIVGKSGSGKTTLLRLINRMIDPSEGNVFIDNQNLKNTNLQSVRRAVGTVSQDCVLFNDTVEENIRYGKPTASAEEIHSAAKLAHIHEPIINMTHGYNTTVGERGQSLSGGERQRVGIARCILKNSKIVLFDEATSALDAETESNILRAFDALKQGRTAIVVAHRLTTVMDADRILVLQDGKIVEQGNHRELLKIPNGVYKQLWESQFNRTSSVSALSPS